MVISIERTRRLYHDMLNVDEEEEECHRGAHDNSKSNSDEANDRMKFDLDRGSRMIPGMTYSTHEIYEAD